VCFWEFVVAAEVAEWLAVASAAAALLRCVAAVAAVYEAAVHVRLAASHQSGSHYWTILRSVSLQKIDLEPAASRLLEQSSVQIDGLARVRLGWSGIWTGLVLWSPLDFVVLVSRGRN